MYQGYLIDLDGTIYLGEEVIPSGKRFIERLQERNLPFLFVTNNSSRLPEAVQKRLSDKFDIHVNIDQIYTSSLATKDYMKKLNKGLKVYAIGEEGLKQVLKDAGFELTEKSPDYVVVGLDKELTYDKLAKATLAILDGAYFIGTNPDKNIPTSEGLYPSNGPTIAYLEEATGVKADIVGKPEHIMMEEAIDLLDLTKDQVLMVGDNYETDIKAGLNNQIPTLLVLSGFTKKEDVPNLPQSPTYIVDNLDMWKI